MLVKFRKMGVSVYVKFPFIIPWTFNWVSAAMYVFI